MLLREEYFRLLVACARLEKKLDFSNSEVGSDRWQRREYSTVELNKLITKLEMNINPNSLIIYIFKMESYNSS